MPYGLYCSYDGVGYTIRLPEINAGTMMLIGDYGLGSINPIFTNDDLKNTQHTSFLCRVVVAGLTCLQIMGAFTLLIIQQLSWLVC